jgi:hypothetical protein
MYILYSNGRKTARRRALRSSYPVAHEESLVVMTFGGQAAAITFNNGGSKHTNRLKTSLWPSVWRNRVRDTALPLVGRPRNIAVWYSNTDACCSVSQAGIFLVVLCVQRK